MALTHGSLVSLYNSPRTLSSKTRLLSVSAPNSNFPVMEWRASTNSLPRTYAPSDPSSSTLQVLENHWDAFVLYVVDPNKPMYDPRQEHQDAEMDLLPGFPRPPPNVVKVDFKDPVAIRYNQPVILQCLATAVASVSWIPSVLARSLSPANWPCLPPCSPFSSFAKSPLPPPQLPPSPTSVLLLPSTVPPKLP